MLVGCAISTGDGAIVVRAPSGVVRFQGTDSECDQVLRLLDRLDGSAPLEEICRVGPTQLDLARDVVTALDEVAGVVDSQHAWRWFARAAANPPIYSPPMGIDEAYALPRWRSTVASTSSRALPEWPDRDPWRRGFSLDLGRAGTNDRAGLAHKATVIAAELMRTDSRGHLSFSSAGAMWPLQVWAVTSSRENQHSVELIDHRSREVLSYRACDTAAVHRCFLKDPELRGAIDRGCGVLVISADPSRSTAKYGDRGWSYTLMECGQAVHRVSYLADLLGVATRPIGGFIERELQSLLGEPGLIPLCTVVLADGGT